MKSTLMQGCNLLHQAQSSIRKCRDQGAIYPENGCHHSVWNGCGANGFHRPAHSQKLVSTKCWSGSWCNSLKMSHIFLLQHLTLYYMHCFVHHYQYILHIHSNTTVLQFYYCEWICIIYSLWVSQGLINVIDEIFSTYFLANRLSSSHQIWCMQL